MCELAALLGGIIQRLPESGWPAVVFARRDALILALATTGLPYTQIAALRVCDVAADPGIDALRVETVNGVAVTSLELARAGASPIRVFRLWCEVLGHYERYPSTRMLAEAVEVVGGTGLAGYDRHLEMDGLQPLLTSIDRWGHAPLTVAPLTARAIAGIVRMHLDGRAAAHLQPRVRRRPPERRVAHELAVPVVVLDSGYYERGTRARRDAHGLLGDVDSVLADVEARAEKVLNDLLVFLESETDEVSTDIEE